VKAAPDILFLIIVLATNGWPIGRSHLLRLQSCSAHPHLSPSPACPTWQRGLGPVASQLFPPTTAHGRVLTCFRRA
jgi:hypothetical protein